MFKFYIDNPRYLKVNICLLTTFPFILKFMVFWSLEMSEKSSRFHLKDSTPFSCEAGKTEHHLLRLQFFPWFNLNIVSLWRVSKQKSIRENDEVYQKFYFSFSREIWKSDFSRLNRFITAVSSSERYFF